jgi:glucosyl-3-phosphoglycerate synthase
MATRTGRSDTAPWSSRTYAAPTEPLERLVEMKVARGLPVTVCLPALNEEATIGPICEGIAGLVGAGLVDALNVVVDAATTDRTAQIAARAGATVYSSDDLLTHVPRGNGGKGDVLWRSLSVAREGVIVWIDADISSFDPSFVSGLLAPLLSDPEIHLVKGFYRRDEPEGEEPQNRRPSGGGRLTELVARPLLSLFYPELAGIVQPLAGETAGLTDSLKRLPFFTGYGVEMGLLIDVADRFGVGSIAQVDLIRRRHRPRDLVALGRASHQILEVVLRRLEDAGRIKLDEEPERTLIQFAPDKLETISTFDPVEERPPLLSIPGQA